MTTAIQLTPATCYHAEGPVWSDSWGGLRWVDMLAGDLIGLDEDGGLARHHVGDWLAAVRPSAQGGAVVALKRQFGVLDTATLVNGVGLATPISPSLWDEADIGFNEGATDPQGRFYCGGEDEAGAGRARLVRLDGDGSVHPVADGISTSNGLAWSPDGDRVYYVDSATQRIDVFDYDPIAGLSGRRPLVTVPAEDGTPDGICVDADGYVWVALWDGFAVRRYAPDGRLDGSVRLPVPRVTACTFGGPGLKTLYITTSQYETDLHAFPESGAVYQAEVGVAGTPVVPYIGPGR